MNFAFFFNLIGLNTGSSHQQHQVIGKKSSPVSLTSYMHLDSSSRETSSKPILSIAASNHPEARESRISSESNSSALPALSAASNTSNLIARLSHLDIWTWEKYKCTEMSRGCEGQEVVRESPEGTGLSGPMKAASDEYKPTGEGTSEFYCWSVFATLCFYAIRILVGLVMERSIVALDFHYLGQYRAHFLIPALCLAIQVAAVSLVFIVNNNEINWQVPFYSSKSRLIRSRSSFHPKMKDYSGRVRLSIGLALALALVVASTIPFYLIHSAMSPTSELAKAVGDSLFERAVLMFLLGYDILWATYAACICYLVSFYFNLICSIIKAQFRLISNDIDDLAESNTSETTNQARKITALYLDHNEACELLEESNELWQYLIFFTFFTYIPAFFYCLYNLFFVSFDFWSTIINWIILNHTGFIVLLTLFSAAGVSTEAHAPYASLHQLALIQLPVDVEVNIITFLNRVRGLSLGYTCHDLFVITSTSLSNTAIACASYFLILFDISNSPAFSMARMNDSEQEAGDSVDAAAFMVGAAVEADFAPDFTTVSAGST